jgi:hypothetical protein
VGRIQLGDVFEINTVKGNAYFQYVYKDEKIGELIRVFSGFFRTRPSDIHTIVMSDVLYQVFFPLSAAQRRKIVGKVGNHSGFVSQKPEQMREKHIIRGEFLGWHIVDTDTWRMKAVKKLSLQQKALSPWGIWNDTLLVQRLEDGWNLDNW